MEELDAALDERGINVVLCARIGLLELFLSGEAGGAERRVHQHDIKKVGQKGDQRDALRTIRRQPTSPPPPGAAGPLSEHVQGPDDPVLRLVKEAVVVDAGKVQLALPA